MPKTLAELRAQAAGGTFCIVPYCHPDFAWTHHREWHEERYAVSTADALDLMREHADFRFCVEPWIDHVIPFLERCPDRIGELRERLNSGQMGVKAFTLTSPRPSTCPDESFLRNMILGRRIYREFAPQADLSVMACPDVGIGHAQMPQVVRLAGASMYRGWRSDSALSVLGVPRDFVWRGMDGTEVITSRGCYGGFLDHNLLPDDFVARWDEIVAGLYSTDLARALDNSQNRNWWVAQGMDDARPLMSWDGDRKVPVMEFVKEWNEREDSWMVVATPNEYARRLAAEDLPLREGVLDQVDVAYNSGWHGQRGLWRLRQEFDTAMLVAERACALARLQGLCAAGPERLGELWVECVRIQSHALQWIFEKDWDWLLSRARYALREAREEAQKAVGALAGVGRRSGNERPLVLFNPLPYEREEIVEVPWVQPRLDCGGHRVLDEQGHELPVQLGSQSGHTFGNHIVEAPLIFRAKVPALSAAVFTVQDAPVQETPGAPEGNLVDTGQLQVRMSGAGIQEIIDTASGLTWQAPLGSCIGDCRLFEMAEGVLHIGPITGEISGSKRSGQWVLTGPIRWVYRWETSFHGQRVRQDIILDQGARHIDLLTRVFCPGANGFFALCLDLPMRGRLHVDVPFGVEERDLSEEVYAMDMPDGFQNIERHREDQFWARSFASLSDGARGVTLITVDGDRYWTYEAESGRLRHILFTPLDDVDPGHDWEADTTKERLALGWHQFRHRLLFHDGDWRQADICGESDRARLSLQAVKPLGPDPASHREQAPLRVEPHTVRLSAFYEDDGAYVLRVYECSGSGTTARIELPADFTSAVKTDFNGDPADGDLTLSGRTLTLPLRAWEIATAVVRQ